MSNAEKNAARSTSASAAALLMLILLSDPLQALLFACPAPVLTTIGQHFGSSAGLFGVQMIMSTPGLGIILAGWPAGRLVQRFGALRMQAFALPIYALCGAAGLVVDSLGALLLSRLLQGCATACIASSALTLVAERGAQSQARLLSWQAALGALAGLLILPLAGWLGETQGWRAPFGIYLLALLLWLVALPWLIRAPALQYRPKDAEPNHSLLHLWPLLLAVVVIFSAIFMRATLQPFVLADVGLTRPIEQAWVLTLDCLVNALGALTFAFVVRRISPQRCLHLCLLILGAGDILLCASSLPMLLAGICISTAAAGFAGPCLAHMVLNRAGPALRRTASGLMFTAIYLGDFINPVLTGPLRQLFGIHGVFVAVGVLCIAGGAVGAVRKRWSPT